MENIILNAQSMKSIIHCGKGTFEKYAKEVANKNPFIVTDSNVYKLYSDLIYSTFGKDVRIFVFPAGEKSKNSNTLFNILKAFTKGELKRSGTVVALGGGVVGDIAGLAAALYMRGVHLVQIPTTLLSQVDSSVGGKTAVDFQNVKNLLGTFYQPEQVIVDPMFLKTLPKREIRCGLGEIIKYGALDSKIYQKLIIAPNIYADEFLSSITYDCILHKAKVVEGDERDVNGLRKTLNLGHTTGHALELYYKRKSHGEFVLIGMYYELYIAEKKGVIGKDYSSSLKNLILKVLTPPAYPDIEEASKFAKFDKKNVADGVSIIVPEREGKSCEIILSMAEYTKLLKECSENGKS
jgi:3-dehydroquinate synthase